MSQAPDTLGVSRKVLRVLITLNWLVAALILALLITTFLAEDFVLRALAQAHPGEPGNDELVVGMRLLMMVGIAAAPFTNIVLTRLLSIVDTVRVGDPFVSANAARLQTIAWTLLVLEIMHLAAVAIANRVTAAGHELNLDRGFSVTPWLAVLLLFVLARVFEHGARMREDLEGTV